MKERSAPWLVAEQLKDICRREPHSAEILAQDLENASMSITEAEKKIKAFADGHRSGGFACVTPGEADAILREEFDRAGLTSQVWQFFTIVPDMRSTGVRDGARVFDWPVIIRAVNTVDAMIATVPELPWALLKRVTDRVLSEVPGVCRVLYDLSPKPVGTIEWE